MIDESGEWPRVLPLFPLGSVALPGVGMPLHIFEPRYRALVMTALMADRFFASVLIERGSEVGGGDQRANVGTLLRIAHAEETSDGRWMVVAHGVERIRVLQWMPDDPFPNGLCEPWPDGESTIQTQSLRESAVYRMRELLQRQGPETEAQMPEFDQDHSLASFQLLSVAPIGPLDQLTALQLGNPSERFALISELLSSEISLMDLFAQLEQDDDQE
ncbi:MAG: LON peptidase substrate-binding domain-containing protein [Acidimicrobiales bacterium]